jgi:replication-associated recombination protein RarA
MHPLKEAYNASNEGIKDMKEVIAEHEKNKNETPSMIKFYDEQIEKYNKIIQSLENINREIEKHDKFHAW